MLEMSTAGPRYDNIPLRRIGEPEEVLRGGVFGFGQSESYYQHDSGGRWWRLNAMSGGNLP